MLKIKIPNDIPETIEPKIPFTKLPNPLGTARIVYEDGVIKYVPLYYIQMGIRYVFESITKSFLKMRMNQHNKILRREKKK